MIVNIQHYFNIWKKNANNRVLFRKYDEWCAMNNDQIQED